MRLLFTTEFALPPRQLKLFKCVIFLLFALVCCFGIVREWRLFNFGKVLYDVLCFCQSHVRHLIHPCSCCRGSQALRAISLGDACWLERGVSLGSEMIGGVQQAWHYIVSPRLWHRTASGFARPIGKCVCASPCHCESETRWRKHGVLRGSGMIGLCSVAWLRL